MTEPKFKNASDALLFCISVDIALRDYLNELIDHADEITARVNRETEMPDELKALTEPHERNQP